MRQVQHGRKPRGRGRKQHNPLSRIYDSSGPDTKIRGTAAHIAEKYQSLARDATSSGHRVVAENYLQHAEHYLRIVAVAQAAMQTQAPANQGHVNSGQNNSNPVNTGQGDQAPSSERRDGGDDNNGTSAPSGENSQGQRGEPGTQPSSRNRRGQRRRQPVFDNPEVVATTDKPEAVKPEPAPDSAEKVSKKPLPAAAVEAQDASVNGVSKTEAEPEAPAPRRRTRRKPKVADAAKDSDAAAEADTAEIA